jgi:hypothetical protein
MADCRILSQQPLTTGPNLSLSGFGGGSTFRRARLISSEVYDRAAPIPTVTPSPDQNSFPHEVTGLRPAQAEADRGQAARFRIRAAPATSASPGRPASGKSVPSRCASGPGPRSPPTRRWSLRENSFAAVGPLSSHDGTCATNGLQWLEIVGETPFSAFSCDDSLGRPSEKAEVRA